MEKRYNLNGKQNEFIVSDCYVAKQCCVHKHGYYLMLGKVEIINETSLVN